MVDKLIEIMELLKTKYKLRVQLSGGQSARLIGPVHQVFLTIRGKEEKFHLGDQYLEDFITYVAREEIGVDFKPSDMYDIKKQLKLLTAETPENDAVLKPT